MHNKIVLIYLKTIKDRSNLPSDLIEFIATIYRALQHYYNFKSSNTCTVIS